MNRDPIEIANDLLADQQWREEE
ncbi:hypothetical protein REDROCK_87 [Mycobacterium phage RedRock]|uniref:Uncharacterized protein n=1 Tax=Mycobacterium phage RedRock TaxID=711470 RepID=D3JZE9_9CAUD|nr:hypothetical protein REDROCK_87 [Mycobacterium phage RedRock]ADB93780.1 hypothetical protein REDROCK_87 [Mycobacterium phage RedRock]